MSRNLCQTDCEFCGSAVTIDEVARPITEQEAGAYFSEYRGMLVANATCRLCKAKYLAWCDMSACGGPHRGERKRDPGTFFDLSFRCAFNDEPCDDDMPEYEIKMIPSRRPWPRCECGGKTHWGMCLRCYKRTEAAAS